MWRNTARWSMCLSFHNPPIWAWDDLHQWRHECAPDLFWSSSLCTPYHHQGDANYTRPYHPLGCPPQAACKHPQPRRPVHHQQSVCVQTKGHYTTSSLSGASTTNRKSASIAGNRGHFVQTPRHFSTWSDSSLKHAPPCLRATSG
eukprot:7320049-Pyramimonas_sp.AAC.1